MRRFKPDARPPEPTTTVLGDWYANRFNVGRHRLIVATNERTLLTLLTQAKDLPNLPRRLIDELGHLLPVLGIGVGMVKRELKEMTSLRFDRTASRSVLASMNQLTFDAVAAFYAPERRIVYLDRVALRLSETPCKRLGFSSPAERVRELFGVPARRRRLQSTLKLV